MARSQELARLFQQPDSPTQRRYEICRAYFLEGATAQQLAQQYQLHVGTVRAITRDFASDPDLSTFFLTGGQGQSPRPSAPRSRSVPVNSVAEAPPSPTSTPLSNAKASMSASRISSASSAAPA